MRSKYLKQLWLFIILIGTSVSVFAQQGFAWTRAEGGINYSEFGLDVTADDSGNVFLVGEYRDAATVADSFFAVTAGASDMFLAKYDPYGNPVWISSLGSSQIDRLYAVNSGPDEHLYITGYGKVIFPARTSLHARDALVARYRPDGTVVWGIAMDGDVFSEGKDIVGDKDGNCYVAGQLETATWIGNDTIRGHGGRDGWLAKFDSVGNYQWGRAFGGVLDDDCEALGRDDAGNIFVGGFFSGTAYFGQDSLVALGGRDAYVAKYDSMGNFVWVRAFQSPMDDEVVALKASPDGDVYFAGDFIDTLQLPGGGSLTSQNFVDIFYGKLDANGNLVWAASAGGSNRDMPQDLELDENENIYIGGYYFGTLDFDTVSTVSGGFDDLFFCKLDSNGNMLHFETSHFADTRDIFGMGVDPAGNILLCGAFSQMLDLGGDTILAVNGSIDIFVSKYVALPFGIVIDALEGSPYCGGDEFDLGFEVSGLPDAGNVFFLELSDATGSFANPDTIGQYFAATGAWIHGTIPYGLSGGTGYRLRIVASSPAFVSADNGYDITLSPAMAIPVVITGDSIICNNAPVVLQVDPGFLSIQWNTGDSSNFIVVTQAGLYSVEATDSSGCSNRDEFLVSLCVGLASEKEEAILALYPNPANEVLTLVSRVRGPLSITIYDLAGRPVISENYNSRTHGFRHQISLSGLSEGVYLMHARQASKSTALRFIIRR